MGKDQIVLELWELEHFPIGLNRRGFPGRRE
jgi:hypothetical protein